MEKTEARRQLILNQIADHLLAAGLKDASLRHLAAAIGTSDRMLLHYFVDKDELMTAALNVVAARLISLLESTRSNRMSFQALMPHLAGMIKDPGVRPYLRLWLELAAMSAANDSYRRIARQICDSFYEWIASVLEVDSDDERGPLAALAFATIEGFVLLDSLDYGSKVDSALQGIALRHSQGYRRLPGKRGGCWHVFLDKTCSECYNSIV